MLIYGAGGHARVLMSCLRASDLKIDAVFDDDECKSEILHLPVEKQYQPENFKFKPLLIAIGDNLTRYQIAQRISHRFGQLIHPSALVDYSVLIGAGTVILHRAIVQAGARIGRHVIINTGATIDHDCQVEDFVHIAPGSILCGNTSIGAFSLIGAGSVIVPGTHIGSHCHIAAGSVITRNIPDGSIVRGNPGRILKQIC
jgi:sugar O-acyltransferase (sialic acid O-acetyltransferase NeuD family)